MTCRCKVCLYYEEFNDRIDLLPVEHQEFFRSMYDDMVHLQSKHNHQRAIINGSWPNADEIIKHKRKHYALHSSGKQ
jgi:hypothetical protein